MAEALEYPGDDGNHGALVCQVESLAVSSAPAANNLLGNDALLPGYPATPEGQRRFMVDLTQLTVDAGGIGVVYWEPYWVSTACATPFGKGSGWENATWFDYPKHEALPVFEWLHHKYRRRESGR